VNTRNTTIGALALLVAAAAPVLAQSPGTERMTGRHSMQGTITSLDEKKGWIHLKTEEGTMILRVAPESLQGLKKGDRATVDLALKDNGPAKSPKR
jgi:hypothetical protein